MPKGETCGKEFARVEQLQEHRTATHNFADEESSLLKRAGEEEKALKRSRGPYRKAHAA